MNEDESAKYQTKCEEHVSNHTENELNTNIDFIQNKDIQEEVSKNTLHLQAMKIAQMLVSHHIFQYPTIMNSQRS